MKGHRFLRAALVIFKVLAWASVVLGVVGFLVILIGGGAPEAPKAMSWVALLIGAIYFFLFYTASAMICLLLEIAEDVKKPGA